MTIMTKPFTTIKTKRGVPDTPQYRNGQKANRAAELIYQYMYAGSTLESLEEVIKLIQDMEPEE
jgi:hypothetical protein